MFANRNFGQIATIEKRLGSGTQNVQSSHQSWTFLGSTILFIKCVAVSRKTLQSRKVEKRWYLRSSFCVLEELRENQLMFSNSKLPHAKEIEKCKRSQHELEGMSLNSPKMSFARIFKAISPKILLTFGLWQRIDNLYISHWNETSTEFSAGTPPSVCL